MGKHLSIARFTAGKGNNSKLIAFTEWNDNNNKKWTHHCRKVLQDIISHRTSTAYQLSSLAGAVCWSTSPSHHHTNDDSIRKYQNDINLRRHPYRSFTVCTIWLTLTQNSLQFLHIAFLLSQFILYYCFFSAYLFIFDAIHVVVRSFHIL